MTKYLEDKYMISEKQYGFTKKGNKEALAL